MYAGQGFVSRCQVLKLPCAAGHAHLAAQAQPAAAAAACLCAALCDPEACHDLIEAQQSTLLLGDIPQSLCRQATLNHPGAVNINNTAGTRARSLMPLNTAHVFCSRVLS
jgi:hypothetical protein